MKKLSFICSMCQMILKYNKHIHFRNSHAGCSSSPFCFWIAEHRLPGIDNITRCSRYAIYAHDHRLIHHNYQHVMTLFFAVCFYCTAELYGYFRWFSFRKENDYEKLYNSQWDRARLQFFNEKFHKISKSGNHYFRIICTLCFPEREVLWRISNYTCSLKC